MNFNIRKGKSLTVRNILEKVDPNKDKYLLKKILSGETNCFNFCIDVIKIAKEGDFIIINKDSISKYFHRVKDIIDRLKSKIAEKNKSINQIENFSRLFGINEKLGS